MVNFHRPFLSVTSETKKPFWLPCWRCMFGVSTRKVAKVVETLCGKSVSKSFVSTLTKELDPLVKEWQERSLSDTQYPYLITDVIYIKVRENRRVVSKGCHIAIGITEDGKREIIGFMIQGEES